MRGLTAVVTFTNAPGSKYAIDLFDAVYDGPFNDKSLETIGLANQPDYRVPGKLMVNDGPNDVVLATVTAPGQFDPAKLEFKTFTGEVWESKRQPGTMNFLVTVKPGNPYSATTLMALYNSGTGEPELLGKLKVYTYKPVSKEVVLVPVGGATVPGGLAGELADIYNKYGITLNISTESYPEFTGEITTEGITRLSRYSSSMKALNSQFRLWATQRGTFKKDAQYLFFLNNTPSGGGLDGASLLGDMPRGKQFGYLFGSANAQTAAHELGHGIFRLAHTFDSSYGYSENSTINLMDYSGGKELVKYQWDILHDVGIAGWLDDSEEGQQSIADYVKASGVRAKYVSIFYNLINKLVISQNETIGTTGKRPDSERALIENVLTDCIYVDPIDFSVTLLIPNDNKGIDCIRLLSDVSSNVINEVSPFIVQAAGLAIQKFGDIIYKAAVSKISFELLKKQLGAETNLSTALNSLRLSLFSNATGSVLKAVGKALERYGNVTLWYTFLTTDMGPGEVTNERIQESSLRAFVAVCSQLTNKK